MSLAIDISCKRGGMRKARFGCYNKKPAIRFQMRVSVTAWCCW